MPGYYQFSTILLTSEYEYRLFELDLCLGHAAKFIVLASHTVQSGDVIILANGANVPFALRPQESLNDRFHFLGPAIVVMVKPRSLKCMNHIELYEKFINLPTDLKDGDPYLDNLNSKQDSSLLQRVGTDISQYVIGRKSTWRKSKKKFDQDTLNAFEKYGYEPFEPFTIE